jgi:multiple sugar transport system permease protein
MLFLFWTVVPIFWMFLSSLKIQQGLFEVPPTFIFDPTLKNYQEAFFGPESILDNVGNSVIVAFSSAAIATFFGALGGYGLSRADIRGKKHLAFWIISTRMAPIAVVIVPLWFLFRFAGLLGSRVGLIIVYSTFNVPFAIWLMRTFFDEIPVSLEEAAIVDGATRWEAFRYVSLPLAAPGLGATAIISLIFAWNDFLFALVFTGQGTQTLPVAVASMQAIGGINWGLIFATGVLVLVPVAVFAFIVRDYLVSGLSMGAVKE